MKYKITGYHNGDENKINELFGEAFDGRTLDLDQWRDNNESNPVAQYCLANMWDGSVLAAHIILWPFKAILEGNVITAATSGTVMASSKYPGASFPLIKWIEKQYPDFFVVGFPNDYALPITTRALKHFYIGDIDFWWKDLEEKEAILKDQNFEAFQLETPSDQCDFTDICKEFQYAIIRNKDYIKWRFTGRKNAGYHYYECYSGEQLIGYFVYNIYHSKDDGINEFQGQIVDIIAINRNSFNNIIRYAENVLFYQGIHKIKMWCTSIDYQNELKELGYSYGMRHFHVELWKGKLSFEDMYLTMADSDVF